MKSSAPIDSQDLAIVAIGCRYPGGIKDARSFWEVLSNGVDTVGPVPADRWDLNKYYDPRPKTPGKMYVREGAFLSEDIWNFDPGFFGVSPLEAERMDPQQRLLLKVSVEALESAHITRRELAGSRTGVYIGSFSLDNFVDMYSTEEKIRRISAQTPTSGVMTMLSARLSYYFGLSGACLSLDTACSSSLVAFHLACQAIRAGDVEQALVGGVNVMFRPEFTVTMCYGGFLAKDGRCKSFDASADGYGRGEGAGVVLIKPYAKAIEDGNEVFAIIRGTGVNQDGRTNGITVPNEEAQLELMRTVSARSGILPSQIGYAEAHGTGTLVGDPKEAYSLGKFLLEGRDPGSPYYVGSVKTNIGHQEAGAGIAAVIKTALCLKHGKIVPNLHFNNPNPAIDFEGLRLRVPQKVMDLELDHACINSFGFGGTNAHAILRKPYEASREKPKSSVSLAGPFLLPVSARSEGALRGRAAQYAEALARNASADLLYTVGRHRDHENVRTALACRDADDAREKLAAFARGDEGDGNLIGKVPLDARRDVTFVYTGMGPQFWGMGRRLLAEEPVFAKAIDELDEVFTKLSDFSLRRLLDAPESFGEEAGAPMSEPRFAQPANLAIQLALTAVYKARGLAPTQVVGHSVGEIAAACVAGSLSIEDAVTISYHRGNLHQRLSGRGGMLAVGLGLEDASPYLEGRQVSVAALNSPTSLTLAGNSEDLDDIAQALEGRNIFAKRLRVKVPYHSVLMEETREDFFRLLNNVEARLPNLPLYSTLTGGLITGADQDCDYWWRNSRESVRFYPAIQTLLKAGQRNFLEIGPHPVLRGSILEILRDASIGDGFCIEAMNRNDGGQERIQRTLAELYMRGVDLDFDRIAPAGKKIALPGYPWDEQRYAYLQDSNQNERLVRSVHPLLQEKRKLPGDAWRTEINPRYFHWLDDHKIQGQAILPGAAYVETMLACAASLGKAERSWAVRDVSLESITPVQENAEFDVRVSGTHVTIHGRGLVADEWERKAAGRFIHASLSASFPPLDLEAEIGKDARTFSREEIYSKVLEHGYGFGPKFQVIQRFHVQGNILYGLLDGGHLADEIGDYLIHPVLLDGVFQVLNGVYVAELPASRNGQYLPSGVDEIRLFRKGISRCWVRCAIPEQVGRTVSMNISIHDMDGSVIGEVHGYRSKVVSSGQRGQGAKLSRRLYTPDWEDVQWPGNDGEDSQGDIGTWLVFPDSRGIATGMLEASRQRTVPSELAENPKALRAFLDRAFAEESLSGILYAWSLDSSGSASDVNVRTGTKDACALLPVLQAVQKSKPQGYRKTVILIQEAMPIPGRGSKNPGSGTLVGLIRTANLEAPELAATVIDLEAIPPERRHLRRFLSSAFAEREVACRASGYLVPRLDLVEKIEVDSIPAASADNYSLQLEAAGNVESLYFLEKERRALAPHEVEIEVKATALNFKDLMKVLGLLDSEYIASTYFGDSLGMECAGVIARIGEGVTHLKVGDAVIAGAADSFAKYVVLPGKYVFRKPTTLSFEEAVILFLNTLTAYYSLIKKANLGPNERVLIHSATGGVGLTAVQIAQMTGAEVYATAGNEEKRQYLRDLGVKHVSDSRSLRFHDDVLKWTGGQGVDVVLNFLTGELMEKSVELLSFGGRFVEIGKADILANNALRLGLFQKNISYTHVDLDYITTYRPDLCLSVMQEVLDLYERRKLRPIKTTTFPAARVSDAFKYMMTSEHIGKLVLAMSDTEGLHVKPAGKPLPIRTEGAYVLTGGFSELGLMGAEWLAAQGARHLCLIGRSGATTDGAQSRIRNLRGSGIRIDEVRADITRENEIRAFVRNLDAKVRGVLHLATVYRDAPLHDQTDEGLRMVLGVKALGAQVLLDALAHEDLDWFVNFSSVSAFGNPSQANYSAANCYLDYLAQSQGASGKAPCRMLSVNWGVVRAGEITRNPRLLRHFEQAGVIPLAIDSIYPLLDAAARTPFPQVAVLDIAWDRFLRQSGLSKSPLFKRQAKSLDQKGGGGLLERYLAANPEQQQVLLEELIIKHVAAVLRIPRENVTSETRMDEIGVDSLMAVTLSHAIEVDTSVELGSVRFLQKPTVRKLASEFATLLLAQGLKRQADGALPRSEDWVFLAKPENARARLVCFPGAGMNARDFAQFTEVTGPVELVGVRYPGGLERPDEAPDSLPLLGQAMADALAGLPPTDLPLVVFGHSFGGLVAYETANAMQERDIPFDKLILAASSTPHAREIFDDAEIARAVSSLELDAGVGQGRYMDTFKRLLSGYTVRPSERPPIQAPIVLVLARKDEFFNNDKLARWEEFASSCEKHEVDVGHFLLSDARVHAIIGQACQREMRTTTP